MKIEEPLTLLRHLQRIHIPGPFGITEVVFRGQFECTAVSHDRRILLSAPALDGVEPFEEEFGIALKLLTPVVDQAANDIDPLEVVLDADSQALDFEFFGGRTHLLTYPLGMVGNEISPEEAEPYFLQSEGAVVAWDEKMAAKLEDPEHQAHLTLTTVAKTGSILKAPEIVIKFGPKGGTIRIDSQKELGKRPLARSTFAHTAAASKTFSTTFEFEAFLGLFRALRHATPPLRMHVGSSKKEPVMFSDDDGFRWLIFPEESRRSLRSI